MKFDHVVMNPPYDGNLHLKVVQEAMKHSDDVVNLSPIRWLQDPLAEEKKGSDWKKFADIRKHTESIEVVDVEDANQQFGIGLFSDLGIYHITPTGGLNFDGYWKSSRKPGAVVMIEKLVANKATLKGHTERNKVDGIRVPLTMIGGNRGYKPIYKDIAVTIDGKVGGKDWTQCKNMGGYEKAAGSPLPVSIKFTTVNEAQNFYDSWKTPLLSWVCDISHQQQNIQEDMLPYLGDYTHPWDDAALYKYFGLTQEEISLIEEEMK